MAQWWYNTFFHTALKITPFEALFGYPPPKLPLGEIPRSKVAAVDTILQERQSTMLELRDNLIKAQERMKKYADKERAEIQHRRLGVSKIAALPTNYHR